VAELILALDLPGPEARTLLDRLPTLRWVKVGPVLFTREGPGFVRELIRRGLRVFLDLKWHDIPSTVAGAVEAAAELEVSMATLHIQGGRSMLDEAVKASGGTVQLVGVSVLTSHSPESFAEVLGRPNVILLEEARRLSAMAIEAGLRGVVCSPLEAQPLRQALGPDPWIVVPGVRRPSDPVGDQVRTASPAEAVARGATHLVVGRPITLAKDPAAVFREIAEAAR
jgi:orotidine-5'-phosphate decarboxylase